MNYKPLLPIVYKLALFVFLLVAAFLAAPLLFVVNFHLFTLIYFCCCPLVLGCCLCFLPEKRLLYPFPWFLISLLFV